MLARIQSYGLNGIEGFPVQVEVDIANGLPAFEMVGLPDAVVRESKERVRAAVKNSGFQYPASRITVNLAPAEQRKEGSVYDLPVAVGMLAAAGQIPPDSGSGLLFLGELALNGEVRPISGVLPMAIAARAEGFRRIMLPAGNAAEAAYLDGVTLLPVSSLREAAEFLRGEREIEAFPHRKWNPSELRYAADFSDIRGQQGAKRAAEVAVAGGHNMLMVGTPGSGKTMLARSIPSILPELTLEEALAVTKIHSVAGITRESGNIVMERPFRAPHHNASSAALIGGGSKALPGEISLSHYGVLFLDELPEFKRDVLESLRQPLEDGVVTITRASAKAVYPAEFMLVAAMNPCPCGNLGSRTGECRCTPAQIARYQSRISAPLLDRIDIHIEMTEVAYTDLSEKSGGESSASIRARVNEARRRQRIRYEAEGLLFNAQLSTRMVEKYCALDDPCEKLMKKAFSVFKLSARAYHRVLKVARTIADLKGSENIRPEHLSEAIQYRSIGDRHWR